MNEYIFVYFVISIIFQVFVFQIAFFKQTDKLTDAAYGLGFLLINGLALFTNVISRYTIISYILICIWALRLSIYLIIRIQAIGKDSRFDKIRNRKLSFLKFFILQGFAIVIISLPHLILVRQNSIQVRNIFLYGGIITYMSGLVLETIADIQKYNFKKTNTTWVSVGLWKYARHPNYFGEMLVWWGLFVFSLGISFNHWYLTILGPISITILLRFITGIPPLEKRYNQKYSNNNKYNEYKRSTRLLIPLP